jgi:3'-phosphoadenosine 5'-phosphosulfate (PAPS) 3'-phosphatase
MPTLVISPQELDRGVFDNFRHDDWRIIRAGSTALKIAMVAEGSADVYLSKTPKGVWDVCAAALILEEAGGQAMQASGAPFSFDDLSRTPQGVIAMGPKQNAAGISLLSVVQAKL